MGCRLAASLTILLGITAAGGCARGPLGASGSEIDASGDDGVACPVLQSLEQADCPGYYECAVEECAEPYALCYGENWQSNEFEGPCAGYLTCITSCACGDGDCQQDCAGDLPADSECLDCLGNEIGLCSVDACSDELDACPG